MIKFHNVWGIWSEHHRDLIFDRLTAKTFKSYMTPGHKHFKEELLAALDINPDDLDDKAKLKKLKRSKQASQSAQTKNIEALPGVKKPRTKPTAKPKALRGPRARVVPRGAIPLATSTCSP